jgi:hypothetical protein
MRFIVIPPPITVKVEGQPDTEWAFHRLLSEWLANAKYFGDNAASLRMGAKLEALFAARKAGEWVAVEDTDYQRLHTAVEESTYTAPTIARQLIPFLDAVADAKKEQPKGESSAKEVSAS